jgi:hypothetical protein
LGRLFDWATSLPAGGARVIASTPADRVCSLCGGVEGVGGRLLLERDGSLICQWCLEGYRRCEHGYLLDCYECERRRAPRREPPM